VTRALRCVPLARRKFFRCLGDQLHGPGPLGGEGQQPDHPAGGLLDVVEEARRVGGGDDVLGRVCPAGAFRGVDHRAFDVEAGDHRAQQLVLGPQRGKVPRAGDDVFDRVGGERREDRDDAAAGHLLARAPDAVEGNLLDGVVEADAGIPVHLQVHESRPGGRHDPPGLVPVHRQGSIGACIHGREGITRRPGRSRGTGRIVSPGRGRLDSPRAGRQNRAAWLASISSGVARPAARPRWRGNWPGGWAGRSSASIP